MTRVAVIGATGQLGTDLVRVLKETGKYEVFPLGHDAVEVKNAGSVRKALTETRPHVVINCAAFVRVDEAEERPEEAFAVNALGALHVARACAELDALCVYISTDYVFDGEKGKAYTEEDPPPSTSMGPRSWPESTWCARPVPSTSSCARRGSTGSRGPAGREATSSRR